MPAWSDHSDDELWATVGFLEKLPGMSEQDYARLVMASMAHGGHHHAGTDDHDPARPTAVDMPHGKPHKTVEGLSVLWFPTCVAAPAFPPMSARSSLCSGYRRSGRRRIFRRAGTWRRPIAWAALPRGDSGGEGEPQPLLDFRSVLANPGVLALTVGYAAAIWGCVGLRQWIVVFLTFRAAIRPLIPRRPGLFSWSER
jgi:hypothetical protein